MSNSSGPASSSNKPGCFGKFIALLTALGGGAGIVALIAFFQNPSPPPPPPPPTTSTPSVTPSLYPPTSEPTRTNSANSNIRWGNLAQYFDIKRVNFQRGFQQASSELSFVAKAKGNFSGNLIVYFYDSDGVKICPSVLDIPHNCSLLGYEGYVNFATKSSNSNFSFWQANESDRIVISVPSNAAAVELNFNQSSF